MTATTTVSGSTPPSGSQPSATPSSPSRVPSTKRPPPPPPSPRPQRTPTPVQQTQSDSQPQLRPKLSVSTPVSLKDVDDAQSPEDNSASPTSAPRRPKRSSLRISVAARASMILALPPGAEEPMPHPFSSEKDDDPAEGLTRPAAFLSPNGPGSAPQTPISPADPHQGSVAGTPTTPHTPLERPAPVRLSSSGPGSTVGSGRARRKPVPSMAPDDYGRRLDYDESHGHSDYTTLPSQSAHTDSLSRSDHWDALPSHESKSTDSLPLRKASLRDKQARRHTLSSGRALEEAASGRSNVGMTDDDEDLLPPRRLGRGRPSVSSISALSMVSGAASATSATPSLPSSPAVQQRGYVLEVDLPPLRHSPSPPLLPSLTGSRSSTFESLPNSSNPNLLAPRPRANTLSGYSIKSIRSGTASTYEPYRKRGQPFPLEAIADPSDPDDPRRPLTPRTPRASRVYDSAASEKASYQRSSTYSDSTPETTAQRLWKWGFLFPPLWIVGMCISCTPFKATLPSETKNRHELLGILQRSERQYARRCALSFGVFVTAVVVIVVVVVVTQNKRG